MLRQQRNRFRTTQRNNRRSPVRGKDRRSIYVGICAKGEIPSAGRLGPGRARPVTGPKLHPSRTPQALSSLSEGSNLYFPRTSGPRIKTELKAAYATFAIERATSYVTFRESLMCLSCPRCAGIDPYLKNTRARAQMFPSSPRGIFPREPPRNR